MTEISYRNCTSEEFEAVFRADHPEHCPWADFVDVKKASNIYGAEIAGEIRGAISFEFVSHQVVDEDEQEFTLSYVSFMYVSVRDRGRGIATNLFSHALRLLVDAERDPIGCGITSSGAQRVFEKLPLELTRHVRLLPTDFTETGYDIWKELGL